MVPAASTSQHTLVDLVCALSTLQTDSVLQLVKEVVKRPTQIKGDEVRETPWMGRQHPRRASDQAWQASSWCLFLLVVTWWEREFFGL